MSSTPSENKRKLSGASEIVDCEDDHNTKKPKDDLAQNDDLNEEDVPIEVLNEAWDHYRAYIDSESETDEGECADIDELQELIETLEKWSSTLIAKNHDDIDYGEESSKFGAPIKAHEIKEKYNSEQALLPALLSMTYLHLGSFAISQDLDENMNDIDVISKPPKYYLEQSLRYLPFNAATLSMLANYNRMNMLCSVDSICNLYELAASNARAVRNGAIPLLDNDEKVQDTENVEDDNEEEEMEGQRGGYKEWVELLFLDGVAGVEYIGDDERDEDEEGGGDGECTDSKNTTDGKEQSKKNTNEEEKDQEEFSSSQVETTASFMAALLNSTIGKHDRALQFLRRFDITHRIHPNVWNASSTLQITPTNDHPNTLIETGRKDDILFEPTSFSRKGGGILPQPLYEQMCKQFAPTSPYWNESDYNNRGYYSFFHSTEKPKSEADNLIRDVVISHLLPLVKSMLPSKKANNIVGFEWWSHTRGIGANVGHNLHFDTDESLLSQEQKVTHPIVSSVLYLTGSKKKECANSNEDRHPAGSTIVFDQTSDPDQPVSKSAWISQARDNSFMIFPGNYLHGVLPCPGQQSSIREKEEEIEERKEINRLTFMVGFWTRNVPDKMQERNLYGPCGPLPPNTDEHTWVKSIITNCNEEDTKQYDDLNKAINEEIISHALPSVSPAWEALDENPSNGLHNDIDPANESSYLEIPVSLDHRFFVKDPSKCFRESLFKDESFC